MRDKLERVVVVGGGAAGVIAAVTLLREAGGSSVEVSVVERSRAVGPGLAYRTRESLHLLNNYAGRMSAFEDDPGHLVRWCRARGEVVGRDAFLPRRLYGAYLADLVSAAQVGGAALTRVRGEVVDLAGSRTGTEVLLASGERLPADRVVLALGNPPPRDLPRYRSAARSYAADPWAADLTDRVGPGARVLLVGTGLTAVDVAAQLADAHHDVEIVAVSRHGLLPRRHLDRPPLPAVLPGGPAAGVAGALARVRTAVVGTGGDWRSVVEAVKATGNDQWASWGPAEQRRFLRHAARRWEVARHRMAPAMADIVEGLLLDGRLRLARPDGVEVGSFDLVVNCAGPAPVGTAGWNPLVDRLAATGRLRPGPHGLGLDVTADGRLVDACGVPARAVHVLGAARRGVEWEVAAVPDLRRQARRLARVLRPAEPGRGHAVATAEEAR